MLSIPKRFARLYAPDVDRALAAAYALVATADGDVSDAEKTRFEALLCTKDPVPAEVTAIASDANALATRMMKDFDPAYRIVSARLKELADRTDGLEARNLVIDMARALIVADGVIAGREETVLKLIAQNLGLPSSGL